MKNRVNDATTQLTINVEKIKFKVDFFCFLEVNLKFSNKMFQVDKASTILLDKVQIMPNQESMKVLNRDPLKIYINQDDNPSKQIQIQVFLLTSTSKLLILQKEIPLNQIESKCKEFVLPISKCPDKLARIIITLSSSTILSNLQNLNNQLNSSKQNINCDRISKVSNKKNNNQAQQFQYQLSKIKSQTLLEKAIVGKKNIFPQQNNQNPFKFYSNNKQFNSNSKSFNSNSKQQTCVKDQVVQIKKYSKKYINQMKKSSATQQYFSNVLTSSEICNPTLELKPIKQVNKASAQPNNQARNNEGEQVKTSIYSSIKEKQSKDQLQVPSILASLSNIESQQQIRLQSLLQMRDQKDQKQNNSSKRQPSRFQQKIKIKDSKLKQYKQKIQNLKRQLKETQVSLKNLQSLKKSQQRSHQLISIRDSQTQQNLKRQINTLKREKTQCEQLSMIEKNIYEQKYKNFRQEVFKKAIQQQKQLSQNFIIERKYLQNQNEQLMQKYNLLMEKYNYQIKKLQNLQNLCNNYGDQLTKKQKLINNLKLQITKMETSQQTYLKNQIAAMNDEMHNLKSTNQKYHTYQLEILSKNNTLETQLKNKNEEISQYIRQLQQTTMTNKQLRKQIKQLKMFVKIKEQEIFQAGRDKLQKDDQMNQRQMEINILKNQILLLKHQIQSTKKSSRLIQSFDSRKFEELQIQKNIKFNLEQLSELERLDKQNKRLVQQNKDLFKTVKKLKCDKNIPFLQSSYSFAKQSLTQQEPMRPEEHQASLQSRKYQIQSFQQNQETSLQSSEGGQSTKKRKLLRKKRIQMDCETPDFNENSLDQSEAINS